MRQYIARNFTAVYLTDGEGRAEQIDVRDHMNAPVLGDVAPPRPRVIGQLADLELVLGGNPVVIDLGTIFAGADHYEVTPVSAVLALEGATLMIEPLEELAAGIVTVSAVNSAGRSPAVTFELSVVHHSAGPEVIAPSAVTLSSTSAAVAADTGLPIRLADLSADGTPPLAWSLDAGAPWFQIDVATQPPCLMLVQMPAEGAHTATVIAGNSAGQAQGSFSLTVEPAIAAPVPMTNAISGGHAVWSGDPITSNIITEQGATYA